MDGLAGEDTVLFNGANATYHLDPIWVNGFDDVAGIGTLGLRNGADLELNGRVLTSAGIGHIRKIVGEQNSFIRLVNNDADVGIAVDVQDIDEIDMSNNDLPATLLPNGRSSWKRILNMLIGRPYAGKLSYARNALQTGAATRIKYQPPLRWFDWVACASRAVRRDGCQSAIAGPL